MSELRHRIQIEGLLADFHSDIEEWASEVAGTPTLQEMQKLEDLYSMHVEKLDGVYGYNVKASTEIPKNA